MKNLRIFVWITLSIIVFSCEYEGYDSYVSCDFGSEKENYEILAENPFIKTEEQQVSTFSIDADGASYSNTRRFITTYYMKPPTGAVRTRK